MLNVKKLLVESGKFRCQPQCLANFNLISVVKLVSLKRYCKTQYACIVEDDESTRKRVEGSLHNYYDDNIAGDECIH